MNPRTLLVLALLILWLAGCASPRPKHLPLGASQLPQHAEPSMRWYRARFRIAWPEGEAVDLSTDTLIAHQVVAPLLRSETEPYLWRFHRRAARDHAGHGFSFLFLVSDRTASHWCQRLEASPMLQRLLEANVVETFRCKPYGRDNGKWMASTSDPMWPERIQRSWPYFIHGLSRFWLGQVEQHHRDLPPPEDNLNALAQHYRRVEDQITQDWHGYGRHALLHHLSALYGYVPGF